eukprot:scaffold37363_cov298-Isochrysis_galbana.AAC.3
MSPRSSRTQYSLSACCACCAFSFASAARRRSSVQEGLRPRAADAVEDLLQLAHALLRRLRLRFCAAPRERRLLLCCAVLAYRLSQVVDALVRRAIHLELPFGLGLSEFAHHRARDDALLVEQLAPFFLRGA